MEVFLNLVGMWELVVLVILIKKKIIAQGEEKTQVSKGKMPFIYLCKQSLVLSCHRGHDEPYCAGSKVHEKQVCKWQVVGK